MYNYTLILGGNEGNVELTFTLVKINLQELGTVSMYSSVYCSEAWGYESTAIYFNQVVVINTTIPPHQFIQELQQIEKKFGRNRSKESQYTDRSIDVDILFCDDLILDTSELIIPHPRLHLRKFCLEPLHEILPNYIHPVLALPIHELLFTCNDNSTVWKMM